jgi:hypothetical protein
MNKVTSIVLILANIALATGLNAQSNADNWPVLKTYSGEYASKVAMPLGGIGTGTVSIGGRGDLRDWEIVNQGALGWKPVFNSSPGAIV